MSVELDPVELGFRRPFTSEVSQTLRLKNPHSDPVAFKVKTTAPKQYCVRPNSGKIDPNGEVEVQVLLQAMREDPPPDAKCKDKFLVQSVIVNADGDANVASIWSNVEQTQRGSIQERKIRVSFLPADSDAPVTPVKKQVNGISHAETSTPSQQSPSVAAFTPATAASDPAATSQNRQTVGETVAATAAGAAAAVQSTARSAVNAVPTSQDELKQQLAAAQAQIEQLRKQAADSASGLRQRNLGQGGSTSEKFANSPAAQKLQQAPGGVPVQVVAILCLVSFILAYLLF